MFLRFVNFYKRFICSYSKITISLTNLLKKNIKNPKNCFFEWPENAKYTFNILRDAFTQTLFLKYFNPEFPIRLETIVSDYALADILTQFIKPINNNIRCRYGLKQLFLRKKITKFITKSFSPSFRISNTGVIILKKIPFNWNVDKP